MSGKQITVGIAGLTHLGITTAISLAQRGFNTVWLASDEKHLRALESGFFGISEPDLADAFARNRDRILITNHFESLGRCDLVYVSPDIPTNSRGVSDLNGVRLLINECLNHVSQDTVVIILSQVPPGFTRSIEFSKQRLFYQVETLVFGQALERALYPERYIVGSHTGFEELPNVYHEVLSAFECPILNMNYESAELTKIAINCYLVSSVCTSNTLAELSSKLGANWSQISAALRLDKRIGEHAYLTPGLGISGGNLERDLETVSSLGQEYNTNVDLIETWKDQSAYHKNWAFRSLILNLDGEMDSRRIGILGLTYKPQTHSIKNSPSVQLIEKLTSNEVVVYDPVAEFSGLSSFVNRVDHPMTVFDDADAVVVMTPWSEFSGLPLDDIAERMAGDLVVDPYRVFAKKSCLAVGLRHVSLFE